MRYGLSDSDIAQIIEVFAKTPNVSVVILFGSRAKGTHKPGSDIDLAIAGPDIVHDDIMSIYTRLDQLGMLYTFDLQNMNVIKDAEVLDHIQRAGVVFYERK